MLSRLFIKDYKNIKSPKVRNAYGILASIVGMLANIILSSAKIVVGILFHSISILADGLNNFSDAGSSLANIISFKVASKPADKNHPFGHARMEYIASLIISFIILFLGFELIFSSIEKLISGAKSTITLVVLLVLAVSILIKIFMFFYYRNIAKKINSKLLKASSIDSLTDAIATTAVLISSIIMYFAKIDIDGYMGIIVAVVIVISGLKLFIETLSPLLGEKPSREFVDKILTKIHSYKGVLGVHDLIVHNYGPNKYYVSAHVEVSANENIMDSHDIIDKIERDFKQEGIELVIHLDPIIVDDEKIDELKLIVREKLDEIDKRLTFHDFRVSNGKQNKKLIFDVVIPSDFEMSDEEFISSLETKIRLVDNSCFIVVDIDRNYIGD